MPWKKEYLKINRVKKKVLEFLFNAVQIVSVIYDICLNVRDDIFIFLRSLIMRSMCKWSLFMRASQQTNWPSLKTNKQMKKNEEKEREKKFVVYNINCLFELCFVVVVALLHGAQEAYHKTVVKHTIWKVLFDRFLL